MVASAMGAGTAADVGAGVGAVAGAGDADDAGAEDADDTEAEDTVDAGAEDADDTGAEDTVDGGAEDADGGAAGDGSGAPAAKGFCSEMPGASRLAEVGAGRSMLATESLPSVARDSPGGRNHSYVAAAATIAASVIGIAQRVQPDFECSFVGSSPIVGAVCCSVGASSVGADAPAGNAPRTFSGSIRTSRA